MITRYWPAERYCNRMYRKFECPHCKIVGTVSDILVDHHLLMILRRLNSVQRTASLEEVCINDDGLWKPRSLTTWLNVDVTASKYNDLVKEMIDMESININKGQSPAKDNGTPVKRMRVNAEISILDSEKCHQSGSNVNNRLTNGSSSSLLTSSPGAAAAEDDIIDLVDDSDDENPPPTIRTPNNQILSEDKLDELLFGDDIQILNMGVDPEIVSAFLNITDVDTSVNSGGRREGAAPSTHLQPLALGRQTGEPRRPGILVCFNSCFNRVTI